MTKLLTDFPSQILEAEKLQRFKLCGNVFLLDLARLCSTSFPLPFNISSSSCSLNVTILSKQFVVVGFFFYDKFSFSYHIPFNLEFSSHSWCFQPELL